MDNGRTLGFSGEIDVNIYLIKYTDGLLGGEGMTVLLRISGGCDAKFEAPFMVFQNIARSYPIRGVPDDVPGVSYRTGPKGSMDTTVMPQWLSERRAIKPLVHQRRRVLFVGNCSGHKITEDVQAAEQNINTRVCRAEIFPEERNTSGPTLSRSL